MSKEIEEIEFSDYEAGIVKSALDRIDTAVPDVDTEWETLRQGLRRRPRVWHIAWRAVAAVAACALLVVTVRNIYTVNTNSDDKLPPLAELANKPAYVYTPSVDGRVVSVGQQSDATQETGEEINEIVELETPVGKDLTATLSDGTKVWLNSGSSLRLYKYFSKSERRVLLRGEAYFEVRHNAARPFVVQTDYFTVNDIGTSFNVRAYSKSEASVALVDGKVDVQVADSRVEMSPGHIAKIKNGNVNIHETDTYPFTQRKNGVFYFSNSTLREIMAEIGRWYGRSVAFENSENMNVSLHFVDERSKSLEQIVSDLNNIDGVQVFLGDDDIIVR